MSRLRFATKFWYGFGETANGFKLSAFDPFLFFYYTQVLGLSGSRTGTAILLALIVDAVTDPLMGSISDHHRSRWGRRHPFIYAAAVPLGLAFFMLFNPPDDLGQWGLFAWLTGFAMLVHSTVTIYFVPHLALGAELSRDYDERTSIVAYRILFTMLAAASVLPLGFQFFFNATPEFPDGQLNPAAYPVFAACLAGGMILTILASALGTHSRIPFLFPPPDLRETLTPIRVVREMREVLRSHSFRWFFSGMLIYALATGVQGSLNIHMLTYFWQFSPEDIRTWGLGAFVGAGLGVPIWALLARKIGKNQVFATGFGLWAICLCAPPIAALLGFFPGPETAVYFPFLVAMGCVGRLGYSAQVAGGSMMADLTDEHELATGRRREGVFFGAISFSAKTSSGLGHWLAGIALDLIRFPTGVGRGAVSEEAVRSLGIVSGPFILAFATLGIFAFLRYRLTRRDVADIQTRIARGRSSP